MDTLVHSTFENKLAEIQHKHVEIRDLVTQLNEAQSELGELLQDLPEYAQNFASPSAIEHHLHAMTALYVSSLSPKSSQDSASVSSEQSRKADASQDRPDVPQQRIQEAVNSPDVQDSLKEPSQDFTGLLAETNDPGQHHWQPFPQGDQEHGENVTSSEFTPEEDWEDFKEITSDISTFDALSEPERLVSGDGESEKSGTTSLSDFNTEQARISHDDSDVSSLKVTPKRAILSGLQPQTSSDQ
jgi:hypothetical protein